MMSRFLHNERFNLSGAQTICLVVSPAKQFSKTELYKSPPAPFGEHLHKLIHQLRECYEYFFKFDMSSLNTKA